MKRAYILLASGYEEVEALMPADVMRRAGYEVYLVSATGEPIVKGATECGQLFPGIRLRNLLAALGAYGFGAV